MFLGFKVTHGLPYTNRYNTTYKIIKKSTISHSMCFKEIVLSSHWASLKIRSWHKIFDFLSRGFWYVYDPIYGTNLGGIP